MYQAILLMIFVLSISVGHAAQNEDKEQIVVKLATDSPLMPLYLAKFKSANSGFDAGFIEKLEQVLSFDLAHNGMTYLVKRQTEKESLLSKGLFEEFGDPDLWKLQNIFYVIKVLVKDKALSVRVYSVNNHSMKSVDNVLLSGDLSKDRRQVHQVADMIHKALFGVDGIASTHILYTVRMKDSSKENKWLSDVWEVDYDGHNARQIIRNFGYCVNPVYMPPKPGHVSGGFFFISDKIGQSKIYIASFKGDEPRRFIPLQANQLLPSISLQRDKVAFISDYTGNPDLFLQPFDPESGPIGKPQQIFSDGTQGSPTFSPDGKRIAFVSNKDGHPRIYVMDIPSPGAKLKEIKPKLITMRNRESTAPSWSLDGTKITYCASTNGVRQIWVYDFAKNEEKQLTKSPGNKENPSWAPNSLHIVFNSTGNDGSELFLINLNQPEAVKITSGSGEKRFPNWEPANVQ